MPRSLRSFRPGWLALGLALAIILQARSAEAAEPIIFFSAASTANAVSEVAALYRERGLGEIETVFASSSTLARQIANGAPADLFLSANREWMDHLAEQGAIENGSQVTLLGNALVLIVPATTAINESPRNLRDLSAFLGTGRLALGDPNHVPAGVYAKEALQKIGIWNDLSSQLVYAKDVRGALALVGRGDAAAGIVYSTDARITDSVRVAAQIPTENTLDIAYPAVIVAGRASRPVLDFFAFLQGPDAQAIFREYGFASTLDRAHTPVLAN